jgi:predicted dehydrogenase
VVCEKPLAMTAAESAELVRFAEASGLVSAVNFNIRFYPLNQHLRQAIAEGALGDVRLVTGRYFQDWLLHETDWNWRLEPDKGGALRAVGDIGSHWLDLMTFITGQPVVSVMADLATLSANASSPPGQSRRSRRRGARPSAGHGLRGCGDHPARFADGARGAVSLAVGPGGELVQYEIDGSRPPRPGTPGATLDGHRAAQRDRRATRR